jgi:hypothetical protein
VAVLAEAVRGFGDGPVATLSAARRRRLGWVLVGIAAFVCARYLPLVAAAVQGDALPAEGAEAPAMTWSIVALDLGVVVPLVLSCVGRLRRPTGVDAVNEAYALLGWFVLVPVSVAAMSIAMLARDDPHASAAGTVFLVVAAVAFSAYGAAQLRPLVHEFSVTNSLVNPVLAPVLRSPAGRLIGGLAVLTYTGRQTGRLHQLVCQVRADRRELLVVVGHAPEKRWWRNFRTPAPVDVWVRGQRRAGTAQAELLDSTTVVRIRLDAPVRRA